MNHRLLAAEIRGVTGIKGLYRPIFVLKVNRRTLDVLKSNRVPRKYPSACSISISDRTYPGPVTGTSVSYPGATI